MARAFIILCFIQKFTQADIAKEDVQFLNELPLDKLLRLKTSLQEFVDTEFENVTTTAPTYQNFGAQAMAIQAPPLIKRGDYEEVWHKGGGGGSKISNLFSMSITTLAFLAFGGYLLCLIVHAVRNKQMMMAATTVPPATFFVSAGIKKKPQPQFASYGRRRRENRDFKSLKYLDLPPEQLYLALIQLCEGYAKWNERYGKEDFSH